MTEKPTPKAYWIASVSVYNMEDYARYVAADHEPIRAYGGVFLVRGGEPHMMEGKPLQRNVVIEFPSLKAAQDCYASKAYQDAKAFRDSAADFNLVIIEGYTDPS